MASLDRLATRQRILEQNGGLGSLPDKNGTNGTTEMNGGSITHSVRRLFTIWQERELCVRVCLRTVLKNRTWTKKKKQKFKILHFFLKFLAMFFEHFHFISFICMSLDALCLWFLCTDMLI